jgi:hypothetical protein
MGNKKMRSESAARLLAAVALLSLGAGAVWGQAIIAGCQVFPANNVWNKRIDALPVHTRSQDYIRAAGLGKKVVIDASVPINVVGPDQPMVPIAKIAELDESDPGPNPIPETPLIEPGGDAHLLILQTGSCRLYEMYGAKREAGQWTAGSTAIFDLTSNRLRPDSWTSTDAAGMPVLPGLLRYAEVQSGEIRHALRMTVPKTQRAYVWPARHWASKNESPTLPPMGTRFRLKRDVDLSGFSRDAQVILLGMKRYGLFVTDNGLPFNVIGAPDQWPDALLSELNQIKSDSFEAVDESELQISANSGQAGPLPPSGVLQVDYASNLSVDLSQAAVFVIVLKGDATLTSLQGATPGQQVVFQICQDAAGNHKFAWPAGVLGAMTVGAAAGKCSTQSFVATAGGLYATAPGALNQ